MSEIRDRFRRDYAPPFLQYLAQRSESSLATAYELGRNAMVRQLSMLDLVQIHHALLLDVLRTSKSNEELEDIAEAASAFFVEVLATFEMAQRGFREARQAAEDRREGGGHEAVDSKFGVTQRAVGMVMERHGLTAQAAVDWLRTTGRANRLDPDEVVARLVQRRPLGSAAPRRRGNGPGAG